MKAKTSGKKQCVICPAIFYKRDRTSWADFLKQQTCSLTCRGALKTRTQGKDVDNPLGVLQDSDLKQLQINKAVDAKYSFTLETKTYTKTEIEAIKHQITPLHLIRKQYTTEITRGY